MRPTSSERRVRRSSDPVEALAWWLQACRSRNNDRTLALADDLGMLLSGAGPARECDELAAWAPLLLERGRAVEGAVQLAGVKLPGFQAYVCTEGAPGDGSDFLAEVAAGCARILGRRDTDLSASS